MRNGAFKAEEIPRAEWQIELLMDEISELKKIMEHDKGASPKAMQKAEGLPSTNRVTIAHVEGVIRDETYTRMPSGKCLVCELTLRNGFTVRGEASVVDPANYDEEIGKPIARAKALDQIWLVEGYLLQETLWDKTQKPTA